MKPIGSAPLSANNAEALGAVHSHVRLQAHGVIVTGKRFQGGRVSPEISALANSKIRSKGGRKQFKLLNNRINLFTWLEKDLASPEPRPAGKAESHGGALLVHDTFCLFLICL